VQLWLSSNATSTTKQTPTQTTPLPPFTFGHVLPNNGASSASHQQTDVTTQAYNNNSAQIAVHQPAQVSNNATITSAPVLQSHQGADDLSNCTTHLNCLIHETQPSWQPTLPNLGVQASTSQQTQRTTVQTSTSRTTINSQTTSTPKPQTSDHNTEPTTSTRASVQQTASSTLATRKPQNNTASAHSNATSNGSQPISFSSTQEVQRMASFAAFLKSNDTRFTKFRQVNADDPLTDAEQAIGSKLSTLHVGQLTADEAMIAKTRLYKQFFGENGG
jgi:hypothetical protein